MFLTSLTGRKYFFIIGVTDAVVTSALCYGVTSPAQHRSSMQIYTWLFCSMFSRG